MLVLESPTVLRLVGYEDKLPTLRKHLEYKNKKIEFDIKRFKNGSSWYIAKKGQEAYEEELDKLKAERIKCILFEDDKGFWTYSGLSGYLSKIYDDTVVNNISYPSKKIIPWLNKPTKVPRYFQTDAFNSLLEVKHGAVEIGTGLGKSFIILMLLKELGLPALIMAPTRNIADQLLAEITEAFGKKYVGTYYGGKKKIGKLFTVALGASLNLIEKDSEEYKFFQSIKVFIVDESHMCPAATLNKVCMELITNAPYRFFFSGTQTRNDGLELVLDGIIGKIVYTMTVKEGVEQGFLSKPNFRLLVTTSDDRTYSSDAMKMQRKHLYYNKRVNAWAAEIANKAVHEHQKPTVILIEEVEQFAKLLPHIRCPVKFAHGGLTKDNRKDIPVEYHDSNPGELVKAFDRGEIPLLIGTSCISMGTDIRSVQCIIYLQGGTSEIQIAQAVGRGTRLFDGKTGCLFYDFDVSNVEIMHRHAVVRKSIYLGIMGPVKEVILQ